MADASRPIPTPHAQRLEDFRRRWLPLIVWSAAALACVALLFQRTQRAEYMGIAQAFEYEISASATGHVASVPVKLFDAVETGDIVARLDDGPVLASLATAQADLARLTAELEATRVRSGADSSNLTAELRRFQIDEEQRRLDALELRVQLESDRLEQQRLELEVRRTEPLMREGVVGEAVYDDARLRRDQVARRIDENRVLLEQTEREYRVARDRRQQYQNQLPAMRDNDALLRPLQESISVAARQIDEIELQRQATILRSPVGGQVSQVLCQRGQAVVPGEPILTVAERSAGEIVAYLDERSNGRSAPPGTRVLLASRSRPERTVESMVIREAPLVQPLPARLWPDPRSPSYGRAVVIAAAPALELTPGELVRVRFLD